MPERIHIGSLPVDVLTRAGAVDAVERLVVAGQGGAVFTPNVDHVVRAERDAAFRTAYAGADLSLADGMPVVWASRLLGPARLPERVAGSDLAPALLARAAERGWRVYLLGGASGCAERAARAAERGGVRIVGADGARVELAAEDDGGVLARVRAARPELLLVGLGSPKQELWIHRNRAALAPSVALGVGAAIDFLAGHVRRAPRWMHGAGLEWAWRLAREPRRLWRRYLVDDPAFLGIVLRDARSRRRAGDRR